MSANSAEDSAEELAEEPTEDQRATPGEDTHQASALDKTNGSFTAWRRRRPFGAGLLMILAEAVILTPAYLSFEVSNIQIQISTLSGVSTLLIGVLLMVCGFLTWFREEGRIFSGVAAMILAIVALPTSNLGGFLLGTLLGLLGGAMALSWTPEERLPKEERKAAKQRRKEHKEQKQQKKVESGD
ncbi:MAG TPA: hypothetical protein H9867_01605 [Candidatus Corynebacterium gallistercoris]|uniref:Uncharacterized protein n=1 Tax=Candidatus Corynebacterium gallistercoris TaxID=2838530 RepID=A0A9D1UP97_9CORY|nr:hypothetical protein [Candidatus Corynebacterium gallistercoris]